jgi:hypothetical protein
MSLIARSWTSSGNIEFSRRFSAMRTTHYSAYTGTRRVARRPGNHSAPTSPERVVALKRTLGSFTNHSSAIESGAVSHEACYIHG